MSTYLIAWAVIPDDYGFKSTSLTLDEKDNNREVEIRVYARKDAVNGGLIDDAVEIARKATEFFYKYFENANAIPEKIDLIGFPNFPSGAMEHWGFIGFRETSLLYSKDSNSLANLQSVAFIISHELAHFVISIFYIY